MKHSAWVVAFLGIGATTLPALAQSVSISARDQAAEQASQRFHRGVVLFREGSFDAALAEFKKAYAVSPNFRVLYNVGQVEVERGDHVAAVRMFQKYLDEGADEIPSQRRADVESEIRRLEGRIATLLVEGEVDGAELLIDGAILGTLPMDDIIVNAGVRRVVIRKTGFKSMEDELTLTGGETTRLEFSLKADASSAPAPSEPRANLREARAPSSATQAHEGSNTPLWVSLAATGVAAGATVVFALKTRSADEAYGDELEAYPGSSSAISEARDSLRRNALITDICGGLAAVGLGTTLYFAFSGDQSERDRPKAGELSLRSGPRGLGWQVAGRF